VKLEGRVAFITGGGGGIGGGLAEALFEKGAKLVLADRRLEAAQAQAAKYGESAIALPLDVTLPESWALARASALDRFGAVDVLCNNAGVSIEWSPLVDVPPEAFDLAIQVNLYGVYYGVKTFGPDMVSRKMGHIVNTSSVNGLVSMGTMGPYSASKFAVTALSAALRQEMAEHGVGVTAVYPGATRSGMTEAIAERRPDVMGAHANMEPVWVGRAAVRAIEQNLAHVISHPESTRRLWDPELRQLADSFGEPAQPGYIG
jgi:NAD(P)-dependent dehydrogenase (short-subunit alcohol dehydrogenase family)